MPHQLTGFFSPLALPKPPGTPVVTESTATSITLTWDSGNPEPVSYYIIQHKPKSSEEPYKEIDGVATTRYSVAGLSPYSEYEFRVVAVNNIGRGPPSEPVSTRTSEQAPSSAPRNVQARMLSSTTILVQWEEPEEPNGQIQGYRVYYTMDPSQHVNSWLKHNVADSHITTIGNLIPQKTYSVKVLAFTSVGDGPLSSDIQVITQTGGKMEFMVSNNSSENLPGGSLLLALHLAVVYIYHVWGERQDITEHFFVLCWVESAVLELVQCIQQCILSVYTYGRFTLFLNEGSFVSTFHFFSPSFCKKILFSKIPFHTDHNTIHFFHLASVP